MVDKKIIVDHHAHAQIEVISIIREPNALATLVINHAHHIACNNCRKPNGQLQRLTTRICHRFSDQKQPLKG